MKQIHDHESARSDSNQSVASSKKVHVYQAQGSTGDGQQTVLCSFVAQERRSKNEITVYLDTSARTHVINANLALPYYISSSQDYNVSVRGSYRNSVEKKRGVLGIHLKRARGERVKILMAVANKSLGYGSPAVSTVLAHRRVHLETEGHGCEEFQCLKTQYEAHSNYKP